MSEHKQNSQERAEKVAALRAAQQSKERRTRLLTIGAVAVVVLALASTAAVVIIGETRKRADAEAAAAAPIAGVEEVADLSAEHVPLPEPTAEPGGTLLPPLGGDHDPTWQNCGIYTEPVASANAVHSLEHGAVWVTYRPDLPADQVATLVGLLDGRAYTLLSPFPDLASPVVLTAWGIQLELDDANDPRAAVFLDKYVQGEQTPEPGAPCVDGTGNPT